VVDFQDKSGSRIKVPSVPPLLSRIFFKKRAAFLHPHDGASSGTFFSSLQKSCMPQTSGYCGPYKGMGDTNVLLRGQGCSGLITRTRLTRR
jgi:hypothetical protein